MNILPSAILKPRDTDRVVAGHPWIYQGSIDRITNPIQDGGEIQVKDMRQRFLGIGLFNSKSKIQIRVLSQEKVELNREFFKNRIQEAWAHRKRFLPGATSFRLVNAESDQLSGLIVDKYEETFVIQTPSLAMDQRKNLIAEILQELFHPKAILERNDSPFRAQEGLSNVTGLMAGTLDGPVAIQLNGLKFEVDLLGGHKTGMYLDQQTNYQKVAGLLRCAKVLDCFTFLGGFALHAAKAGAVQVHGLDQSADAIKAAEKNAARNDVADRCSFETVNVFDWLKNQTTTRPHEKVVPKFEGIILDPPSFTRTRAAVDDAMRGYKEIHLRALKLLKKGGILATFCCSHHVSAEMFEAVILSAAYDARRLLRKVDTYAQSPDHPIIPAVPETEYLKGFAFEVFR